jgi:uncharacterized protein
MGAIAVHHTATTDSSWDGPQAKANLKADQDEAYYRKAFAWQDSKGDPKTKAAYKFIHHEVSGDGSVGSANVKACQSGIGILNGAESGTNIPDGDRKGVHAHLAAHLKDAGLEPAELKSASESVNPRMERRFLVVEQRAAGDSEHPVIEGMAAVFNQETQIGPFFREKISPGAFTRVLSEKPDVIAAFNHNWDIVLGRTTAGTLQLEQTDQGLQYEIDVNPADQQAMDIYQRIKRRDVPQASYAFTVRTEEWTKAADDNGLPLRDIKEIDELYDVSPCTFGAYPQASTQARDMALSLSLNVVVDDDDDQQDGAEGQQSSGQTVDVQGMTQANSQKQVGLERARLELLKRKHPKGV